MKVVHRRCCRANRGELRPMCAAASHAGVRDLKNASDSPAPSCLPSKRSSSLGTRVSAPLPAERTLARRTNADRRLHPLTRTGQPREASVVMYSVRQGVVVRCCRRAGHSSLSRCLPLWLVYARMARRAHTRSPMCLTYSPVARASSHGSRRRPHALPPAERAAPHLPVLICHAPPSQPRRWWSVVADCAQHPRGEARHVRRGCRRLKYAHAFSGMFFVGLLSRKLSAGV